MGTVKQKNIVITGFMGTGKTTVGQHVARLLFRPFHDTDELIQKQAGLSIPEIFRKHGEAHFRGLEKEVIISLSTARENVIATGGGSLLQPENVREVNQTGIIFCLEAGMDILEERLRESNSRPLLDNGNLSGNLRDLLADREEQYAQLPNHIDTSDFSPLEIAQRIITIYQKIISGSGDNP